MLIVRLGYKTYTRRVIKLLIEFLCLNTNQQQLTFTKIQIIILL